MFYIYNIATLKIIIKQNESNKSDNFKRTFL